MSIWHEEGRYETRFNFVKSCGVIGGFEFSI